MMKRTLAVLLLPVLLSGCGTVMGRGLRQESSDIPAFYPATYADAAFVCAPWHEAWGSLPWRISLCCGGFVDIPISLVMDTLLLPLDAWMYCRRSTQDPMDRRLDAIEADMLKDSPQKADNASENRR